MDDPLDGVGAAEAGAGGTGGTVLGTGGVTATCGGTAACGLLGGSVDPGVEGWAGVDVAPRGTDIAADGGVALATGTHGTTVGSLGGRITPGMFAGAWRGAATRAVETAAPMISWLMAVVAKCFIPHSPYVDWRRCTADADDACRVTATIG